MFTWIYLLKKSLMLTLRLSISKSLLSANLILKFSHFSQIGAESMKNYTLTFTLKASPIMSHVHVSINKMVPLRESIAILLK
jgi:hypothetical protein